jgi:hypothetical protein
MPTSTACEPLPEGAGERSVTVRLSRADVAALDRWIAAQSGPKPSRAEAVRRLMNRELGAFDEHARDSIRVSELNSGNDV